MEVAKTLGSLQEVCLKLSVDWVSDFGINGFGDYPLIVTKLVLPSIERDC